MSYYTLFENEYDVFINHELWDIDELERYEITNQTVLYYIVNDDCRYYSLGSLEALRGQYVYIVADNLTDISRYKTGRTRQKYLFDLIRDSLF